MKDTCHVDADAYPWTGGVHGLRWAWKCAAGGWGEHLATLDDALEDHRHWHGEEG